MDSASDKVSDTEVLDQVKLELQLAYIKEFYQTVHEKCFDKCVTRPGTSLSRSEQSCLSVCFDRYAEATQIVQKALLESSNLQ